MRPSTTRARSCFDDDGSAVDRQRLGRQPVCLPEPAGRRQLVDGAVAGALADEATGLGADLAAAGLEAESFFAHAIPLSVSLAAPDELARVAVAKTAGLALQSFVPRLSRRIASVYAAFRRAHPRALEELELRHGPIASQWEARGPGLLAAIGRLTEPALVVESADAILVHPVLGGNGRAYPACNAICFEAVLANPIAELPEVVRLGWLLAQLNLDLPRTTGDRPSRRMDKLGALAMIPPTLAAAEEVELARVDANLMTRTIAAWRAGPADGRTLATWWETYCASPTPWPVALGALERMLS